MTDIELRPMTAEEFEAIKEYAVRDYAADHVRAGSRPADKALEMAYDEFARLLPDGPATPEHHMMIGFADGERVGSLWIRIPEGADSTPDAFVFSVEVEADQRGKGFGRALMLAAEDYARDHGAKALRLHVFGHNTVARSLYESLGYQTTNVNMVKPLSPTS